MIIVIVVISAIIVIISITILTIVIVIMKCLMADKRIGAPSQDSLGHSASTTLPSPICAARRRPWHTASDRNTQFNLYLDQLETGTQ